MGTSASSLSSLLSSVSSPSGIDISSILEAALGASSPGIDVTSAVNAAVTAAEAPEQTWETEESTLQSQVSALTQIQTDASTLDNDMQSLNSITGPLSAMTVSSSNANVVSASAASGSTVGNHVIVVNNLATTASWTSATYASGSTAMPAGSFTITNGSGTATTITADGTETLSDIASQINADDLGVTANVITDDSGSRLAIVAGSSGTAANFTVASSGATDYGFTQAATGGDASLTVDGISVSSATNAVTGVVPGVTLNLLSADPGVEVSLGVAPDTSQIQSTLQQFVTDYNTVVSDLSTQFTFSGTSEGPLASDSTVRNLQSAVLSALDYTYTPASGSTTVPNLSSLGISVDNNGQLSLDTSTLQSALQTNFSDVQSFFQGTSLNGFANSLDQQLTSFISPADGAFTVDLQSMNSQYTDLENDISDFQTNYIAPLQTQLQADYSQAEIALQELPNQLKEIDQELGENNSSSN
ncbi:MAG TPA: flagellar filament capping protein FliD [Terriglobales bacterium]